MLYDLMLTLLLNYYCLCLKDFLILDYFYKAADALLLLLVLDSVISVLAKTECEEKSAL